MTAQLSEMEPWLSLDVSPALESTQYTCWAFGSVPYAVEEGDLWSRIQQAMEGETPEEIPVGVELLSQSNELTCVAVMAFRSDFSRVEQALRGLGFTRPNHLSVELPKEKYQRLDQRREALTEEIQLISKLIAGYASQREDIRFLADYYQDAGGKIPGAGKTVAGKERVPADRVSPRQICSGDPG